MSTFEIRARSGASTYILAQTDEVLRDLIGDRKAVVLTDSTVEKLYGAHFPLWPILVLPPGEGQKSIQAARQLYESLLEMRVDRSTVLIGFGGGVICDLAGFVAATYLRGLPFGFVPTTLLAQVDASIGGKNGVNLKGYKNLIGTVRQPEFILCDCMYLRTLPMEQLRGGFAEIIKAGAIADPSLLGILLSRRDGLLNLDEGDLRTVIQVAAKIKAGVVCADETEQGERRKLNFGHTLGHALEKVFSLAHGDAVAIGMAFSADLSVQRGLLKKDDAEVLRKLIASYGLPVKIPPGQRTELLDAMGADKKREQERIHMILLRSLGQAVDVLLSPRQLEEALK